jgi:hypothetical protein
MPALRPQYLQELRRADDIVNCGRIGLVREVVDSATKSESLPVQRNHSFNRQIQVEIHRIPK